MRSWCSLRAARIGQRGFSYAHAYPHQKRQHHTPSHPYPDCPDHLPYPAQYRIVVTSSTAHVLATHRASLSPRPPPKLIYRAQLISISRQHGQSSRPTQSNHKYFAISSSLWALTGRSWFLPLLMHWLQGPHPQSSVCRPAAVCSCFSFFVTPL